MCTVSFISRKGLELITANRDEDPRRAAALLQTYRSLSGDDYWIAREPVHGGSNLAISKRAEITVLLNGAWEAHERGSHYRKSRGLVVLDSLEQNSLEDFCESYDFEGIEPFTMLRLAKIMEELRWDGSRTFYKTKAPGKPAIWASAQLYEPEVRAAREVWFEHLLSSSPSPEDVLDFHKHGGIGDPWNDMCMNRFGLVRTVSITQLCRREGSATWEHLDLVGGNSRKHKWEWG